MVETIMGSIAAISATLKIIKQLRDLAPESPEAEELEKQIVAAEKQLKLTESQLAQALHYPLCRCTFPPQIMLFNKEKDADICEQCGHIEERPRITARYIPSRSS